MSAREEFDTVAGWTADAIMSLSVADAVPAACNGSGNPFWLDWLAEQLGLRAGMTLLDTGAGLGGPAAWMARRSGAAVVTVEPMLRAVGGGRRLFALLSMAAWSHHLPVAGGRVDVALALAVLSTVDDKPAYLAEVRRVLVDGGRLGVIEYVSTADPGGPGGMEPDGNDFARRDDLVRMIESAGFEIEAVQSADRLPPAPPAWVDTDAAVTAELERAHGSDPAWTVTSEERSRFARLLAGGDLGVVLVAARRCP